MTKCAIIYMLCTLQSMACCLNLPAPNSVHILLTPKESLGAESTTSTYGTCPALQGPDPAQGFWALPEHKQHRRVAVGVTKGKGRITVRQFPPRIYQKVKVLKGFKSMSFLSKQYTCVNLSFMNAGVRKLYTISN